MSFLTMVTYSIWLLASDLLPRISSFFPPVFLIFATAGHFRGKTRAAEAAIQGVEAPLPDGGCAAVQPHGGRSISQT